MNETRKKALFVVCDRVRICNTQIDGEIRAIFTSKEGKLYYVVEHESGGPCIYDYYQLEPSKAKPMITCKEPSTERAVVVTTQNRGVFFGYATDTNNDIIKLRSARNCLYWPAENKGFMGLAEKGPLKGARVGPAADISLRGITSVIECTSEAVVAWESMPWSQ